MLFNDINNTESPAHPANREAHKITNTLELFAKGGFHGGVWRCAFTIDSVGLPSVLIHFMGGPTLFLPVFYGLLSALAYYLQSAAFLESGFVGDMKTIAGF
jgi:hypothetical protein